MLTMLDSLEGISFSREPGLLNCGLQLTYNSK